MFSTLFEQLFFYAFSRSELKKHIFIFPTCDWVFTAFNKLRENSPYKEKVALKLIFL